MNSALKWKLIAGFALVFIAGAVTGVFFAAIVVRHCFFAPASHGMVAERMRQRLRTELRLTPEQMARISPIVDKTAYQLETIRTDTTRRVHEALAEAHHDMAATLTPEQQQKLQQMQERHRRWMHHFHSDQPSPGEMPPGK